MKNIKYWKETKIITRNKKFIANPKQGIGSFLITTLVLEKFVSLLDNIEKKFRILDIGCGSMPHYTVFRNFIAPESYIGIDWNNTNHQNENIDNYVDLNKQDIVEFAVKNKPFDVVLLCDVLEHLHEPKNVLKATSKLLNQKSSYALITVPFYYWIHEKPHDYNRFTIQNLKRLLGEVDLEIERYEIVGGFGTAFLDLISKNVLRKLQINNFIFRKLLLIAYKFCEGIGLNNNKDTYPIEYILKVKKKDD